MIAPSRKKRCNPFLIFGLRSIVSILICTLVFSPSISYAQQAPVLGLPKPGTMVSLSSSYVPVIVKGLHVHSENPLLFDFIVDTGDSGLGVSSAPLRVESEKLIKYFLASLTIPEDDLWVNLSPYEKNRIIPQQLGQTVMGRDMLAQDYVLKQLTASLTYPEKDLGKEFWNKVYTKAQNLFGSSEVPVNTFNKVWIVADKAKVYVHDNTAFVVACHMKVMLEEDYLAMYKHEQAGATKSANSIGSQVVREVVIPELEREVNQGKNFANLRQIFNSMILAAWYKKSLKKALLNQVYSNKAKINGINLQDKTIKERIYQEYLKAYKKGVFNYIKEDIQANGQTIARKYFSGGAVGIRGRDVQQVGKDDFDAAMFISRGPRGKFVSAFVKTSRVQGSDAAMTAIADPMVKPKVPSGVFDETDVRFISPKLANGDIVSQVDEQSDESVDLALRLGVHVDIVSKEREQALPYGFALDFDKKRIYVTQGFADKVKGSKNHLFGFYARAAIEIDKYLAPDNQVMPSFERRCVAIKEANAYAITNFSDSIDKLFIDPGHHPYRMRDREIANLSVSLTKQKAEYVKQVREITKYSKITVLQDGYKFLVRKDGAYYLTNDPRIDNLALELEESKAKLVETEPNSLMVVMPTKDALAANREAGEIATRAADIMLANALNGIADYTKQPPTSIEGMKLYKGKLSMVKFFSKFNPPTIAHENATVFLAYALSGADSYLIGVTYKDFRKVYIGNSFPARKELAHISFDSIGQGKIGYLEENPLYDLDNGEEVDYKIYEELEKVQEKNPELVIESVYPFGDDHNQIWAANIKDGEVHGVIWDKWDPVLERMYEIWAGKNWEVFKKLIEDQLDDPGNKWFYSETENKQDDYLKRKRIIDLIIDSATWEEFRSRFDALSLENQIIPRLESFGKLFITKSRFPGMKITAMRTARPPDFVEDRLRDKMLKDGRMTIISVPGFSGAVSATFARNFLNQMIFRIFNFRLGYVLSSPVLEKVLNTFDLFHLLTRQDPIKGLPGNIENGFLSGRNENVKRINTLRRKWGAIIKKEAGAKSDIIWKGSDGVDFIMNLDKGGGKMFPSSITVKEEGGGELAKVVYTVNNALDPVTGEDINRIVVDSKAGSPVMIHLIVGYIMEVNNNATVTDSAMNASGENIRTSSRNEGGIDFNAKNLQMDINGEEVDLKFDPAMAEQFQRGDFSGVVPIIIQITPVLNLSTLLGVNPGKGEEALVKV